MPQPARKVIEMAKGVVHLLLRLRVLATRSSVGSISLYLAVCALLRSARRLTNPDL